MQWKSKPKTIKLYIIKEISPHRRTNLKKLHVFRLSLDKALSQNTEKSGCSIQIIWAAAKAMKMLHRKESARNTSAAAVVRRKAILMAGTQPQTA